MKLKGIDEMILSKATKFLYFIWIHTYIHRERERERILNSKRYGNFILPLKNENNDQELQH
jgi:hypothetical protein